MDKKVIVTVSGLKALEDELEMLKTVRRSEISEKIRVARGYGDLSENSEYDEAKNEQAKIEARIIELEKTLEDVVLINDDVNTETVTVG
ncbi:MAG: transcription elongation factor GreA, partial [Oscillospiraceae bacterium]|nr:transcription elongation factor GreA [Oscillospiraceae bacterium]